MHEGRGKVCARAFTCGAAARGASTSAAVPGDSCAGASLTPSVAPAASKGRPQGPAGQPPCQAGEDLRPGPPRINATAIASAAAVRNRGTVGIRSQEGRLQTDNRQSPREAVCEHVGFATATNREETHVSYGSRAPNQVLCRWCNRPWGPALGRITMARASLCRRHGFDLCDGCSWRTAAVVAAVRTAMPTEWSPPPRILCCLARRMSLGGARRSCLTQRSCWHARDASDRKTGHPTPARRAGWGTGRGAAAWPLHGDYTSTYAAR